MKTESLQYSNRRRECIEANRSTPTQRSLLISSPHIGASACPGHTIYSPIIEKWLGGLCIASNSQFRANWKRTFCEFQICALAERKHVSMEKQNAILRKEEKLYLVNYVGSRSISFSLEKALMHFWISKNLIQTYLQYKGRRFDGQEAAFLWTVTWYVPIPQKVENGSNNFMKGHLYRGE